MPCFCKTIKLKIVFSVIFYPREFHLQVIAESLSEEEIAGLKEMFKMIDADNSGQITFEELKAGLKRVGANLKESEIYDLMQAVCTNALRRILHSVSKRAIHSSCECLLA